MPALNAQSLPPGWIKCRDSGLRRKGVAFTWAPSAASRCLLAATPAKSGRIRSLLLVVGGWRSFLVYRQMAPFRHEMLKRLLEENTDSAEYREFGQMIEELLARSMISR